MIVSVINVIDILNKKKTLLCTLIVCTVHIMSAQ